MTAHVSDTPPPEGEEQKAMPVEGSAAPQSTPEPAENTEETTPKSDKPDADAPAASRGGRVALVVTLVVLAAIIVGGWLVLPRTLQARREMEDGRRKLVLQDYDGARDAFQRSVESMPTYAASAGAAMLYLRDGNFQDAERFLTTAAQLKPRARETMILQARLNLFKYFLLNLNKEQGNPLHSRFQEDVLLINLGVELKDDYPDEAGFISETPTALKSHAEYLLRTLVQQDSGDVEALGLMGALALYDGRYGESRETFEQVRELKPEFPALQWAFAELDDPWMPDSQPTDGETFDDPDPDEESEEVSFPVPGNLPEDGLDDLRDSPPDSYEAPPLSVETPRLPIDLDERVEYEVGAGGGVGVDEGGESSHALSERLGGDTDAYEKLAEERNRREQAGTLYRFRPVSFDEGPHGSGVVKIEDILGRGGSVIPLGGERRFDRLGVTIGVTGDKQKLTISENGVKQDWVRLRAGWFADWEAEILLAED